jgi:hypothetical protein
VTRLLEEEPARAAQLPAPLYAALLSSLQHALTTTDLEIGQRAFDAVFAVASFHFSLALTLAATQRDPAHLSTSASNPEWLMVGSGELSTEAAQGVVATGQQVLRHFLGVIFELLISSQVSVQIHPHAANALFALVVCQQEEFKVLVMQWVNKVPPQFQSKAMHHVQQLVTGNGLTLTSLSEENLHRWQKNLRTFLQAVIGLVDSTQINPINKS